MGRGLLIFLSSLLLVVFFVVTHDWVGAQEKIITLENKEVFKKLQRPPVKFPHEKLADLYPNCTECHHTFEYQGGKRVNNWNGEGQPCSECHKVSEEGKTVALMNAFHENCTGCHRQLDKEGKKSGPVTCGECHVR